MTNVVRMSWLRVWLVYFIFIFLVGASVYDIVTNRENWPFSPYAMYSYAEREHTLEVIELFGVTQENGTPREIPLLDSRYLEPFDQTRLRGALSNLLEQSQKHPQLLTKALEDCLVRYEKLSRAGHHDGPHLSSIRLYRLQWQLDPWARNVERPDKREILAEVTRPER